MMKTKTKYPILERLMAKGYVWKEGEPTHGEYAGLAADGVVVTFGMYDTECRQFDSTHMVEKYLTAHPTPETW